MSGTHTDLLALSPAAHRVLNAVRRAGGRPLVVGGAVRDALLGTAPHDIDIEVHGQPPTAALTRELERVGSVDERGRSFGILAVRVEGQGFELSVPRRAPGGDAGRRGAPSDAEQHASLRDALSQHDLTINAMGWDPATGELFDPFGGRDDLRAGVLRATSDAFGRDPLRVWRVVQFAGRFGFRVEHRTAALCERLALLMLQQPGLVAQERVWMEWAKLLRGGVHWTAASDALVATGAIKLLPELEATIGVPQDPGWHPEGDVYTHLMLSAQAAADACGTAGVTPGEREVAVLAALLHDLGKAGHTVIDSASGRITSHGHAAAGVEPARAFLHRIGAAARVARLVVPLIAEHMSHVSVPGTPSRAAVRRLARRLAPASLTDWARLVDADRAGRGSSPVASPASKWLAVAASDPVGTTPIVKGRHLISLGMEPGPEFAGILRQALEAQDDGAFSDEASGLAWVRQHVT